METGGKVIDRSSVSVPNSGMGQGGDNKYEEK